MKSKSLFLLSAIFCLALFLRIYHLGSLPKTLYEDEVLIGYIGRFIIINGQDVYGNSWPLLYFNKFGDYYIILPMYLSGLSTKVFGINDFAIRFPTALIGALVVFPTYWLITLLTKNKRFALLASLLVAIAPWHIVLSRASTESIIEATFVLTGICFLVKFIQSNRKFWILPTFFLFILAYDTYHTSRIYIPLVLFGFLVIFFQKIKQKRASLILYLCLALFFMVATIYIATTPWGKGRFGQTSIFNEQSGVQIIITELTYNLGQTNPLITRIFHNKLVGFSREYIHQYLLHLSPEFLVYSGWLKTRYAVPESGPLFLFTFLLFVGSLIFLRSAPKSHRQGLVIFLFLLIIAPIPTSITVIESPNVRRALFLVIPISILAAYTLDRLLITSSTNRFRSLIVVFIFIILGLEFLFFSFNYSRHHNLASSLYRNDGNREVAQYLSQNKNLYDSIHLPSRGTLPFYYLFFSHDFNKKYIGQFKLNAHIDQIDNLHFYNSDCLENQINPLTISPNSLIIEPYTCQPDPRLLLVDKITNVNPLLGYRVYRFQ